MPFIVLWRVLAEIAAEYSHNGSLVYLESKIKTINYVDKEDKTRYVTEIIAESLIM